MNRTTTPNKFNNYDNDSDADLCGIHPSTYPTRGILGYDTYRTITHYHTIKSGYAIIPCMKQIGITYHNGVANSYH